MLVLPAASSHTLPLASQQNRLLVSSVGEGIMSFLTLFTADAAAAHGHEFSPTSSPSYSRNASPSPIHRVSTIASVSTVTEEPAHSPSSSPPPKPNKIPKSKTSYHLAQPPPTSHHFHRHSLKSSKALVMQVQQLSNLRRPLPTFDVLPAAVLASKYRRRLPHLFKGGISGEDLVILTSEEYTSDGDAAEDDGDDESLSSRQVVASMCQSNKRCSGEEFKGTKTTIIRLGNGSQWVVVPMASGGYEFISHDDDEEEVDFTVRWIPRSSNNRRRSYQLNPEEKKFQFSVVNANSRKHPIIASMSRQKIDILDHYPLPWTKSSPMSTPPHSNFSSPNGSLDDSPVFEPSQDRVFVKTGDELRILILVTGIWVALHEGFAGSNFRMDDLSICGGRLSPSPSVTNNVGCLTSPPLRPKITPRSVSAPVEDQPAGVRILRHGSLLVHNITTNTHRENTADGPLGNSPKRAHSTGSSPWSHTTVRFSRNSGIGASNTASIAETTRKGSTGSRTSTRPATPTGAAERTSIQISPEKTKGGCSYRRSLGGRHPRTVSLQNPSQAKQAETLRKSQDRTPPPEVIVDGSSKKDQKAKRRFSKLRSIVNILRGAGS